MLETVIRMQAGCSDIVQHLLSIGYIAASPPLQTGNTKAHLRTPDSSVRIVITSIAEDGYTSRVFLEALSYPPGSTAQQQLRAVEHDVEGYASLNRRAYKTRRPG